MADPPPSTVTQDPRRALRRAEGLLNSNGQVVKELDDAPNTISLPSFPWARSQLKRLSVRSIKRKFVEVKDASRERLTRSRSVGAASVNLVPEGGSARPRNKHARSHSDAYVTRPPPRMGHAQSAPNPRTKRSSIQQLPSLSESRPHSFTQMAAPASTEEALQAVGDIKVPLEIQKGTVMSKVTNKKHKKALFRLDADLGQIVWESKQHRIIPIENIKEIRSGLDTRYYREQFQLAHEYEDRWITIIYILDGSYKIIHLIAPTKSTFRMWETTLRKLYELRQELMSGLGNLEMRQALWEKQCWTGADEERDQKLTFDEVEKLCKRLNINTGKEDLLRLFKKADVHKRNYLEFRDFQLFVKLLKSRSEVTVLYNKLRSQFNNVFSFEAFERFMREKQKSTLTRDELHELFTKYASPPGTDPHSPLSSTPGHQNGAANSSPIMTIDAFTSFLLSPDNSAFSDQHHKIWQDMTRPLSEYYISSSHNTYLVGHQLVGMSTIEGYIRALLHSCRSVELDIYDGDIEPMIFHGKTFTTKLTLREVCHAIMKYGFIASPYPIIISAEVHCSVPQQDQIAQIMIEVFGDHLVRAPVEGRPKIDALPSPEDLRGKILLKTKNLNLLRQDSIDSDVSFSDFSASSTSDSELLQDFVEVRKKFRSQSDSAKDRSEPFLAKPTLLQRVRSVGRSTPSTRVRSPPNSPPIPLVKSPALMPRRASDTNERPKVKKMSSALLDLLVYTVGVKCRGINKKEEYAPEHMFSLSENFANKMLKTDTGMVDLIKHCRTHLVRVYPKGLRVNSTNYEPHRYWSAGAQLVALNWQTFDLGYMINHAMFQRNGRSGYVLKPPVLRLHQQKELLFTRSQHLFEVTIISAQQLPRPKDASGHEIIDKSSIDPFVEVSILIPDWPEVPTTVEPAAESASAALNSLPSPASAPGMSGPRTITYRTSVVKNNGFNPIWQQKLHLPFDCVGNMKDLIFVRFIVRQEDKEDGLPLAVYCASLGSLEQGYRHLPLHDSQLTQYLFSTLFVRINIVDV